jgi:RNA polymerase sigma-70 factor (ECF subfamily)
MLNQDFIIQGCIDGDRRAQQSLYEHFYGKMLAVCMRYANGHDEALDMFQEAFIKVFKNLHKYGKQGSFEGWVRRIMVNTSIDHIRKNKKNNQMVELDDKHGSIEADMEEDSGILEHINFTDLIEMVQHLSPAYRSVFNMYIVDGFTHQEISDFLGISVGTSKSNLAKAKKNLRKMLQEKLEKLTG